MPQETQRFSARGGDMTKGKPLVVLINGGSRHRPPRSWPARSRHDKRATPDRHVHVQTIIPLGGGNGALALTTACYFTPRAARSRPRASRPMSVLQDVPDELKSRAELKGEASMRGHLAADGAEHRLAILRSAERKGRQGA